MSNTSTNGKRPWRKLRGTGFKHTLPYVWRFSNVWVFVFLVSLPGTVTGFLMSDVLTEEGREATLRFMYTQMPIMMVVIAVLSVMLTARLAGPFVAIKRAFADVAAGDMTRRLRFRREDRHLADIEDGFNAMMERVESQVRNSIGVPPPEVTPKEETVEAGA